MTSLLKYILLYLYFLPSSNTSTEISETQNQLTSEEIFKNEIEETIKNNWTQKMRKECKEVFIVKESEHIYRGFANFLDGSQVNVKITVDGSNYIYEPDY